MHSTSSLSAGAMNPAGRKTKTRQTSKLTPADQETQEARGWHQVTSKPKNQETQEAGNQKKKKAREYGGWEETRQPTWLIGREGAHSSSKLLIFTFENSHYCWRDLIGEKNFFEGFRNFVVLFFQFYPKPQFPPLLTQGWLITYLPPVPSIICYNQAWVRYAAIKILDCRSVNHFFGHTGY